jgi:hypothetical protein
MVGAIVFARRWYILYSVHDIAALLRHCLFPRSADGG